MSEDLGTRLSEQVTTLSTKLVTEVAKLLELEEALLQARKENAALKMRADEAAAAAEKTPSLDNLLLQLAERYARLQKEHKNLQEQCNVAEEKNKQLEGEVEDLTASLFSEANEMVSNASREAYNFKLKNRKLMEELGEKDSIIANLQDELKDLKELFIKIEDLTRNTPSSRSNTPKTFGANSERFADDAEPTRARGAGAAEFDDHLAGDDFLDDEMGFVLNQLIYGPKTRSIRLDLPQYQHDFKTFVYMMIRKDFSFDLASLKALKYFKRIWTAEIESSLGPTVPSLSGATFMNRWSKGKSFWSLLVEGKAVIEPVAGVNETFKLSYKGVKSGNAVPVALREPCGICGESKDDLLEHARLYSLKLYGPASDSLYKSTGNETISIAGEKHDVVGDYPLCNYCLVKLRAICDFFAKLRSIHSNIYKLQPNAQFESAVPVNSFQFKRASMEIQPPVSSPEDEPVLIKLYLMLLVLRAKIFWASIGFWDTLEDVESLNIDDIKSGIFKRFISENVAYSSQDLEEVQKVGPADIAQESEVLPSLDPKATSSEVPLGETNAESPANAVGSQDNSVESQNSVEGPTNAVESQTGEGSAEATQRIVNAHENLHNAVASSNVADKRGEFEPGSGRGRSESDAENEKQVPNKATTEAPTAIPRTEGKVSDMIRKLSANGVPANQGKKLSTNEKMAEKKDDSEADDFQDASEETQPEALALRQSKTKAFNKKIHKDLDDTLSMLQESIE